MSGTTSPPAPAAALAAQSGAVLLGAAALLLLMDWRPGGAGAMALAAGAAFAAAGFPLAVWTAQLTPALRHIYNGHFAVAVGCAVLGRALALPDAFLDPDGSMILRALVDGFVIGCVATGAGAIAAPFGHSAAEQRSLALAAALAVFAAAGAALGLAPVALLLAAAAAFAVRAGGDPPPPMSNARQGAIGIVAYAGMNVVAAGPWVVWLVALVVVVWRAIAGTLDGDLDGSAALEAAARIGAGLAMAAWAMAMALLLPAAGASRKALSLGAASLVLAFGVGGAGGGAVVALVAVALLAMAAAMGLPPAGDRKRRWPGAMMLGLAFGIAGANAVRPSSAHPATNLAAFSIEALLLAVAAVCVYFAAIGLRARLGAAPPG